MSFLIALRARLRFGQTTIATSSQVSVRRRTCMHDGDVPSPTPTPFSNHFKAWTFAPTAPVMAHGLVRHHALLRRLASHQRIHCCRFLS
jgi:hypothetical protein